MNAALLGMGASAHNIANQQTPGFRRQQVALQSQAEGGVAATLVQAPQAEGDSLAEDLVQQKMASYSFKANVLSLRTGYEVLGTLLDMHA